MFGGRDVLCRYLSLPWKPCTMDSATFSGYAGGFEVPNHPVLQEMGATVSAQTLCAEPQP